MNGPQLQFLASWGGPTPESFDSIPWERTHRGGGFSLAILLQVLHFLKPYGLGTRTFVALKELVHLECYGSVFTRSPSPRTPYTIQLIFVLYYLERSIFKSVTVKYLTK